LVMFSFICWMACGHSAEGETERERETVGVSLVNGDKTEATKILYIVRHAKSGDATPGMTDFDRPLEEKGELNAKTVGEYLKRKNTLIDLVVISPSKRTQQTAEIICAEIGYGIERIQRDSSIYGCTLETYLEVIKNLDDSKNSVMVVGHNPATTQLANFLQKKQDIQDVPTGGIIAIEFSVATWKEAVESGGKLLYFHDPDDITDKTD